MTISRVLVANRGEIARRIFRTCRAMGIETVAVFSDPDSNAPHSREADIAVQLDGASPAETYLDSASILSVARSVDADAVHPGYGFLSENAEFAAAVARAGLTWIGPEPHAIELMGSKLRSKALMSEVGVPGLPSIPVTDAFGLGEASQIGFPLLVKASAGGGGKGMRVVSSASELTRSIESAQREASAAFGDGTVFLEKYLADPRHIEIQVFGDKHGNVVSLFERECSIQRRHQKIIEESPSPVVTPRLRKAMGEAAILAATAVDYVGAGTVEFLFQDDEFFFLEMNTRLQVEHPVTEMVTGLDLVRLQIEVALGANIGDLRPEMSGHAIEARLYAEDPRNDFLPVTGALHTFDVPEAPGLRVDSGVESGSTISVHYDPMLAKIIAHGQDRAEAAAVLARALRGARIHGSTTNRSLLVRILEDPGFLAGDATTSYLQPARLEGLSAELAEPRDEQIAAVAAALSDQAVERANARVLGSLPSGWRNSGPNRQSRSYLGTHGEWVVDYSPAEPFHVEGLGEVHPLSASEGLANFTLQDEEQRLRVNRKGPTRFVDSTDVPTELTALSRFPKATASQDTGSLVSPMPGRVAKVNVDVGDEVAKDAVVVVLEAMKMEHSLRAPDSGVVERVLVAAGDQVEADQVLVVVASD